MTMTTSQLELLQETVIKQLEDCVQLIQKCNNFQFEQEIVKIYLGKNSLYKRYLKELDNLYVVK
jgi:hypothetical protein